MKSHGNFTLKLNGHVVHAYALDGFNEFGIIEYREEVLKLVSNETSWLLFEHIEETAGLTPEAIGELILTYKKFEKFGCIAIVVEIGFTFGSILEERVFNHINIPTIASKEQPELIAFIDKLTK
jgi:hypothetical protein